MILMTGTKADCIKKMLELESVHGRKFWVVSLDDSEGNYQLESDDSYPTRSADSQATFCPLFPSVESIARYTDSELCELANVPLDDSPTDHLPSLGIESDCDDDIELTF
jgi:hypothetical protein